MENAGQQSCLCLVIAGACAARAGRRLRWCVSGSTRSCMSVQVERESRALVRVLLYLN